MLTEEQLSALKNYKGSLSDPDAIFYFLEGKSLRSSQEEEALVKLNSPTPDEETLELKKRIPYDADDVMSTFAHRAWSIADCLSLRDEINEMVLAKYGLELKDYPREFENGENYEKVRVIYMKKKFPNVDPTLDFVQARDLVSKYINGQKIELYEYLKKTIKESTHEAFGKDSNKRVKF